MTQQLTYNHHNNITIWVLGDNRPGNTHQALALAEELTDNYLLKTVKYNWLSKLPNWILKIYPIHVSGKLLHTLTSSAAPDLIISAGRKTAPIALYLRSKLQVANAVGYRPKLIHIMQPEISYDKFDWVILPSHDSLTVPQKNIIRITGALNNVSAKLENEGKKLRENYPHLGKFAAVIVGGNNKKYTFTDEDAMDFVSILKNIPDMKYFISFSRRTPHSVKHVMQNATGNSAIIYDPTDQNTTAPNPYLGMLAEADYIITTCDSISMCSEAASTGKPLYIFRPPHFASSKHNIFINQLINAGMAKALDKSLISLQYYHYTPLNEVKRIIPIVKPGL